MKDIQDQGFSQTFTVAPVPIKLQVPCFKRGLILQILFQIYEEFCINGEERKLLFFKYFWFVAPANQA